MVTTPGGKRPHEEGRPPARKRVAFPAASYGLPKELGECVKADVELLERVGWEAFVKTRRRGGDISDLNNIERQS